MCETVSGKNSLKIFGPLCSLEALFFLSAAKMIMVYVQIGVTAVILLQSFNISSSIQCLRKIHSEKCEYKLKMTFLVFF